MSDLQMSFSGGLYVNGSRVETNDFQNRRQGSPVFSM
jgi:hypothetical protein